jgi:hypothetical protein
MIDFARLVPLVGDVDPIVGELHAVVAQASDRFIGINVEHLKEAPSFRANRSNNSRKLSRDTSDKPSANSVD